MLYECGNIIMVIINDNYMCSLSRPPPSVLRTRLWDAPPCPSPRWPFISLPAIVCVVYPEQFLPRTVFSPPDVAKTRVSIPRGVKLVRIIAFRQRPLPPATPIYESHRLCSRCAYIIAIYRGDHDIAWNTSRVPNFFCL